MFLAPNNNKKKKIDVLTCLVITFTKNYFLYATRGSHHHSRRTRYI